MDKQTNILYVNTCVRSESRTDKLARRVLDSLDGEITEIRPYRNIDPIRSETFINSRSRDSDSGVFSDDKYTYAKQFAAADIIVIAAPYWDLSFPAVLKAYIEQINVVGITFEYTDKGTPKGLCSAKKLIYVTTAGGPIISDEYGYGYIRTVSQTFYGIGDVSQVKAEGLDVIGADVDRILDEVEVV